MRLWAVSVECASEAGWWSEARDDAAWSDARDDTLGSCCEVCARCRRGGTPNRVRTLYVPGPGTSGSGMQHRLTRMASLISNRVAVVEKDCDFVGHR